ncbi:MAG: galactokinase family protein [Candidatus Latescibacterota bacterium]
MKQLGQFASPESVAAALRAGGLRDGIDTKANLFTRAANRLLAAGGSRAARAYFVPGRIEVLGKHTDYCGGRSLVAAVERGICLVAAPRDDGQVHIHALDADDSVWFGWDPDLDVPVGRWTNYPMTVARRLARNFPDTCRRGADIAFAGDLPQASGLSSSSALVVATYRALADVEGVEETAAFTAEVGDELSLAEYLGTHENGQSYGTLTGDRGVGTFGGSEDHTAILCSQPDALGQFGYCPTRFEARVPVPEGWVFALGVSGVVAEKTGAAQVLYNRASLSVRSLVDAWNAAGEGDQVYLARILASSPDAPSRLRAAVAAGYGDFTAAELEQRLSHFEAEDALIDSAAKALAVGDLDAFGESVARSQEWTESMLGNQVPETILLAQAARHHGAAAASAFGAGFGGCVWALVRSDGAADFLQAWAGAFHGRFPSRIGASHFFTSPAGPAAFELNGTE